MRFTVAWAHVISENLALKLALACLALVIASLSVVTLQLENRKPLVVERACLSRTLPTTDGTRTSDEVEVFIRATLPMRFDSGATVTPDFLSDDEARFRAQEQQEFKKRSVTQRVVVNHVSVKGDEVLVDADRLFSVGSVRSALSMPLVITVGSIPRTEWNPYGLTLLQVAASPPAQASGQTPLGGGK